MSIIPVHHAFYKHQMNPVKRFSKLFRRTRALLLLLSFLLIQNVFPISSLAVNCNGNQPACPSGFSYVCPSGQAPCCIQFSDEAGCSNGLSCFGGTGICVSSTSTTSTSSTTGGGVIMCGGDNVPDCPIGLNLICPSGETPCCLFSDEAGCSNGLSCYGGRGFCGTSSTSSTSSTGGVVIMCGGDSTPDCPIGQGYLCPSGQAPCCLFSDEAGCSNGLSCYGGRGSCVTSTSSTSSTSSGTVVIMCGGDDIPDCPIGQNYLCPSGQAPCCILFSDEAGCSNGLSCYGGRGFCGVSSSSSSGSTSSSSSSSGGFGAPFCSISGQILCSPGVPTCSSGLIPTCGSVFGLPPEFAGPGCVTQSMQLFFPGIAFCTAALRVTSSEQLSCDEDKKLCPSNRERFKNCREDRASCRCVCQFKTKREKYTPRCSADNQAICSKGLTPTCSDPLNEPVCSGDKLFCRRKESSAIDLGDFVSCPR